MITFEKLRLYKRYNGDVDLFGRSGKAKEREMMPDSDWFLIDTLLQDATVITRQLGSEERTKQAWQRIRDNTESEALAQEVIKKAADSDT